MAFVSHGAVAASVRKSKNAHPERYCRHATCLWRTMDHVGNPTPCPRHSVVAQRAEVATPTTSAEAGAAFGPVSS